MTKQRRPIECIREAVQDLFGGESKVIKVTKAENGWSVEAEVIEESEHMKKVGVPVSVYNKYIYTVLLDQNYTLLSYERKEK